MESFVHQRGIRDDLVTALYELNDLKFDLAPRGYDLDTAWPSFAQYVGMFTQFALFVRLLK